MVWLAAAVLLALGASVLLLCWNPVRHRAAQPSYAQLENKEDLFPPPPSPWPDSGETYVYTPLTARSAEQPPVGSPISPDAHPNPPPDVHPNPPPRLDDPPLRIRGAFVPSWPPTVVWLQRPTARRISELYPQRPLRDGVGGRVQLECSVLEDLAVECEVLSEQPPDQGFGRAALSASKDYRVRPTLTDGASAVGARTRITVNFVSPQQ
jgi:protein TonB